MATFTTEDPEAAAVSDVEISTGLVNVDDVPLRGYVRGVMRGELHNGWRARRVVYTTARGCRGVPRAVVLHVQ